MSEARRTRLYEKGFRYVPAAETNLERTFARIRKQQKEAAQQQPAKVTPIKREGK